MKRDGILAGVSSDAAIVAAARIARREADTDKLV